MAIGRKFDHELLKVPVEAQITSKEVNQLFVPIFDKASGKLSEDLIGAADIASPNPAEFRKGCKRMTHARLADAKIFWHEDLRPLDRDKSILSEVTRQTSLNSLWDKTMRIALLQLLQEQLQATFD